MKSSLVLMPLFVGVAYCCLGGSDTEVTGPTSPDAASLRRQTLLHRLAHSQMREYNEVQANNRPGISMDQQAAIDRANEARAEAERAASQGQQGFDTARDLASQGQDAAARARQLANQGQDALTAADKARQLANQGQDAAAKAKQLAGNRESLRSVDDVMDQLKAYD